MTNNRRVPLEEVILALKGLLDSSGTEKVDLLTALRLIEFCKECEQSWIEHLQSSHERDDPLMVAAWNSGIRAAGRLRRRLESRARMAVERAGEAANPDELLMI